MRRGAGQGSRIASGLARAAPLLALLLLALPGSARAAFPCFVSAGSFAFGSYDPTSSADLFVNWTVQWLCLLPARPYITIGGSGGAGAPSRRVLTNGASASATLHYNLYQDAAHTRIWGDGSDGTTGVYGTYDFMGTATVFGRIPAGQDPLAGWYTDTIVVGIQY